jgi:hypothetical protein
MRMVTTCSTWSGHQAGSNRMAQGNVTSIFKGGSMDATQCNSYRPITVLPVIDKLFAAVLTERLNKTFTARSPVSVQERAQHTRSAAGSHRAGASVMACARVLPRHAKGIRQGLACWLFWKLHKNGITGKLWRIIHELYANSASTRSSKGRQQNCTESSRALLRACHVTYTVQRVH